MTPNFVYYIGILILISVFKELVDKVIKFKKISAILVKKKGHIFKKQELELKEKHIIEYFK